jgi:hypothetical protein
VDAGAKKTDISKSIALSKQRQYEDGRVYDKQDNMKILYLSNQNTYN